VCVPSSIARTLQCLSSAGSLRQVKAINPRINQYIDHLYGLVLVLAAAVVGVFAFYNPVKFYEDFCRYYLMGKLATGPDRLSFYSLTIQAKTIIDFWGGVKFPHGLAFNTPPIVIPLMILFSFVKLEVAYLLWCLLNASLFLAGTWLILSDLRAGKKNLLLLFLIFAGTLSSTPGAMNVAEGQAAGIICGLIAIFFWAFQHERYIVCGITLGLIIFKFQYLPFLLVPVLVYRHWQTIAVMVATDTILIALTAMLIGIPNLLNYPSFVLKIESDPNYSGLIDPKSMVNLKGMIDVILPALGLKISLVCLCLGLAVLAKIWLDTFDKKALFPWAVSLTVLIALLLSLHTHDYDSILLAIPFLFTCPALSLSGSLRVVPAKLRVWNIIFILLPVLTWIFKLIGLIPAGLKYFSQILIEVLLLLLAAAIYVQATRAFKLGLSDGP
jgi:hypothetical protein